MGRGNDLERSDGSDGDGSEHTVPKIPGDTGGSDVASGEVQASEEPSPKTKRVASEKMKAALLRDRTAKAEKRRSRTETKQPTIQPQPQFFFDIV
jgi:hypothetical protein